MLDKITKQSIDFTVVSEIDINKFPLIDTIECLHGTPLQDTGSKNDFLEILNSNFTRQDDHSFIGYYQNKIIIKESNFLCFNSDYYINKLVSHFPDAQISFIRLTLIGSDSIIGGELRVIKNKKTLVWLRAFGTQDRYTDFDNGFLQKYNIDKPNIIGDKKFTISSIEEFIKRNLNITDFKGIYLTRFNKVNFLKCFEDGVFDKTICENILETIPGNSSDILLSRAGRGSIMKSIPQEFVAASMPLMKELKEKVLKILSKSFENDGFDLLKSKGQLTRKTKLGEDIIGLASYSYNNSQFELVVGTRNDSISKLSTDFNYSNSFSTNKNYKTGYTIACSVNSALFGNIIASSYNNLSLQLYQTINFIKSIILTQLDSFQNIKTINNKLNYRTSVDNIDFFSPHEFKTIYKSIDNCIVSILANDIEQENVIDDFLMYVNNNKREIYKAFFQEIKKYAT